MLNMPAIIHKQATNKKTALSNAAPCVNAITKKKGELPKQKPATNTNAILSKFIMRVL